MARPHFRENQDAAVRPEQRQAARAHGAGHPIHASRAASFRAARVPTPMFIPLAWPCARKFVGKNRQTVVAPLRSSLSGAEPCGGRAENHFGACAPFFFLQRQHLLSQRRGSQVVRPSSAKALCAGSIPARASKILKI